MKTSEKSIKICKILYIEDNNADTRLIKELLLEDSDQNFEVISREKLVGGLDYLKRNKVDVILLDLSLPDSSENTTFEKVKSIALNIPIIILTGSSLQRESLRQCLDSADGYLVKGEIDSSSLISAIKQAIQKTNTTKDSHNVKTCTYSSTRNYIKDKFKPTWDLTQQ